MILLPFIDAIGVIYILAPWSLIAKPQKGLFQQITLSNPNVLVRLC